MKERLKSIMLIINTILLVVCLVQISNLKTQITETDYQIIKTYEYSLVGLESEYDIGTLHVERQNLRDQINELEEHLSELLTTE